MADQVENKIVNVIFDNKDFSKKIDATIRDLQRFEQEIDNISKNTITINYNSIESRHNIQKALFDLSKMKELNNIEINISANIDDVSRKLSEISKINLEDKMFNINLNIDSDAFNNKLDEVIKNIKINEDSVKTSFGDVFSKVFSNMTDGIIFAFGEEFGDTIISNATEAFKKIDFTSLLTNAGLAFGKLKDIFNFSVNSNNDNKNNKNNKNPIGNSKSSLNISSIKDNILNAFSNISSSLGTIFNGIGEKFYNIFEKSKEVISKIDFSTLINKTLGVFNTIWLAFTRFKDMVLNAFKSIGINIDLNGIKEKFKSVFSSIISFIAPLAISIKDKLKQAFTSASSFIQPFINVLKNKLQNIDFKGMINKFKDSINKFKNFISPVTKAIKDSFSKIDFKGMANKFKEDLKGMYDKHFSPFIDKIKEKINKIDMNEVANKVSKTINGLSNNKLLMGAGLLGGGLLLGKKIPVVGDMINKLTGGSMQFNQSLDNINQSVDNISSKFTVMGRVWFDTLTRMAQNAVDAGLRMVKSLSVDNIMSGYQAMEAKNNSIRTIMNSTVNNEGEDDEAKLERITDNVEKLVTFTDETSYNFQDMMNGLSSFTSAGVELEKSVSYMMGIANWAAYAGKNAKEAGTAFDVMSKVIANGNMDLMRFRQLSTQGFISNATRKQWLEMASKVGTLRKEIDSAGNAVYKLADGTEVTAQNMETTLTKGKWLNADVITQSLGEYAKFSDTVMMYYDNITSAQEEMAENGENVDNMSNERLDELAKKYNLATSDLKKFGNENVTVSKLIDILGNSVDENGNRIFEKFSVEAFKSAQEARTFGDAIESVKVAVSAGWSKSFETIFGNVEEQSKLWTSLANRLYDVFMAGTDTRNLFLKFAKDGGAFNNVFMGISNLFNSFLRILNTISDAFKSIFFPDLLDESKGVKSYADSFIKMTENFATWTAEIAPSQETIDNITNALKGLFSIIKVVLKAISALPWGAAFNILTKFAGAIGSIITSLSNGLINSGVLDKVNNGINKISNSVNKIKTKDIIESLGKLLAIIIGLKLALGALRVFGAINSIAKGMETLQRSMRATVMDKQASALLKLAGAIALISASLLILSKIDFDKTVKGLIAVAVELGILIAALKIIDLLKIGIVKVNAIAISIIAFAGAILLLTASVAILGKLKWSELGKGMLAIIVLLAGFTLAFTLVSNSIKGLKGFNLLPIAAAIIAFAGAMVVLSAAVAILGHIGDNELKKGLISVGLLLAGFTLAFIILSKAIGTLDAVELLPIAAAIIAFAGAMVVLSAAVAILGHIGDNELKKGLISVGLLLAGLTVAFIILSKVINTFDAIGLALVAASLLVFSTSMVVLAGALAIISSLDGDINESLLTMAKMLGGIIVFAFILSKLNIGVGALQIIALAGALLLASVSFKILQDIDFKKVADGILLLLVSMTGLAAIGYIANGASVGLLALSAVLLSAGAAAFLFGAGIDLGAKGIELLSNIDYQKIIDGFSLIAENANKFYEAASALAAVGLAGIIAGIGTAVQGLGDVIGGFGKAIDGIGEGIGKAVSGIGEGIGNFFKGGSEEEKLMKKAEALMKVAEAMEKLKDIGEVTVATEGLQSSIDNVIKEFSSSIQNLEQYGKDSSINYMRGIINGLKDEAEIEELKGSVINLANTVKENFDKVLKIESPSKVGKDEGGYYVIGIGEGIDEKTYITEEAAKKLGLSTAESFEEELSDEKAKYIADNWTEDMAQNLKEKENDFKTIGKDEGGYYVEGIKDGVEGKHYITDEAAEELGISMVEETKKPFTDENQKKSLIDNISSFFKDAVDNVDLNNLKNVGEKVANNLLPKKEDSENNSDQVDEKEHKKKIKAHKSFLKSYKKELEEEKKMVKYFANEQKKLYEEQNKNKDDANNQFILNDSVFKDNAQNSMNSWLDSLATTYEAEDALFKDYLENLDENTSKEDQIYARRMEALRKFKEDNNVGNSGFDLSKASVTEKFKQETSKVKPHEAAKNLQSYLDAYKVFQKDMEKFAGTNISNAFLGELYKSGPNGDLFLAAKSMGDNQLEVLGKTWDEIHGLNKDGDSEFLLALQANRDTYKATHKRKDTVLGSKENPYVDEKNKSIYVTEDAMNVTKLEKLNELSKLEKDADKLSEYQDQIDEMIDKIAKKESKGDAERYQEISDMLHEDYDIDENEISEDDTFNGPGVEKKAYDIATNQINSVTDGFAKAQEDLGNSLVPTNVETGSQFMKAGLADVSLYTAGIQMGIEKNFPGLTEQLNNSISTLPIATGYNVNAAQNLQNATQTSTTNTTNQQATQEEPLDEQVSEMENRLLTVEEAIKQILENIVSILQGMNEEGYSNLYEKSGAEVPAGLAKGIISNIGVVTEATKSMCIAAIQAAREELGIASPSTEFYRIGEYIIEGLCNAISDGQASVTDAMVKEVLEKMEGAAEDSEEISSPSKKWYRFGSFIDQGLANGISDNVQAPMNALGSLISGITDNMEMDEDYNPVITPVIDLSEAKKQSKGINTLFANNQAMQISADLQSNRLSQNEGKNSDNTGAKTITFTQNNYSPKELSRLEIYRQTNNQFSQLKTLLDK